MGEGGHAQSRKLGPYALVRLLGRGGMGAVWEALDTRLNRRVAVKVMVAGEHASEQETERFRREAQNSAKLRHPNIVPVHDFGIEAGQHYLVMDLVDGVMLADALRQRQFTYREKALLLEKVARAVQYAHEQGVVHRDLKPSQHHARLRARRVVSCRATRRVASRRVAWRSSGSPHSARRCRMHWQRVSSAGPARSVKNRTGASMLARPTAPRL